MDFLWIKQKLLQRKKYWHVLEEIISQSVHSLQSNIDLQLKSERLFEILSQILIDVCTHIIAHSKIETPKTYSDCMRALSQIGIISQDLSQKAIELVKMRNLIVHQYGNINYELLFEGLKQLFKDFPKFHDEINDWIMREQEAENLT